MDSDNYETLKAIAETHTCQCDMPLVVACLPDGLRLRCKGRCEHCPTGLDPPRKRIKSLTRRYLEGEALGIAIENKLERKLKKEANMQEGSKALEMYRGVTTLTRPQAAEILEAIWPKAPASEKTRAAMLCTSYQLNPLMRHVFLVPFKDTWATIMGIQATRLIASRQGAYSYIENSPRIMTEEEQTLYRGKLDPAHIWAVVVVQDIVTGAVARGYGSWPKATQPYGTDKGNSQENMAMIRAERQALDRLRPGEMPQGIEVMEAEYLPLVPQITRVEATEPQASETSVEADSILEVCPEHGEPWTLRQAPWGAQQRSHKLGDKEYCNLVDLLKNRMTKALGGDEAINDLQRKTLNDWLKVKYASTWSKLTEDQMLEAVEAVEAGALDK